MNFVSFVVNSLSLNPIAERKDEATFSLEDVIKELKQKQGTHRVLF
ncbi:MAG: hypothetical protein ACXWT1_17440 [Methylobacter sp.]